MEKIDIEKIKDYINLLNGSDQTEEFEPVNLKTILVDLEKCYEEFELVIQRKYDSKFFKGQFSTSPYGHLEIDGLFTECKKRTRVVTEVYYK